MARGNRGGKADADTTADAPAQEPGDPKKGSNAPRPRKWDYGIAPEAQIVRLEESPSVKRDVAEEWAHTEDSPTCALFMERGGTRHGLRVMSRRKLIKIVNGGKDYPIEYTAPVKEEKQAEPAAA